MKLQVKFPNSEKASLLTCDSSNHVHVESLRELKTEDQIMHEKMIQQRF